MLERELLPIGTVVLLKESTKRAMIVGLCQKGVSTNKLYDYAGVVFPEGFISGNKMLLFNNDQIERIFVIGYQDEEQISFMVRANETMAKLRADEGKNEAEVVEKNSD